MYEQENGSGPATVGPKVEICCAMWVGSGATGGAQPPASNGEGEGIEVMGWSVNVIVKSPAACRQKHHHLTVDIGS